MEAESINLWVGILGSIATVAWTLFIKSKWARAQANAKRAFFLECIAAGVARTYETFVRSAKANRQNKTLLDPQRIEAMERAKQIAAKIADEKNLDIRAELGEEFLELHIEQAITAAKRAAKEAKK